MGRAMPSLNKGNVASLKSYTDLPKTLGVIQEVVKEEQHRLNYEKLKALNSKLQIEQIQSQNRKNEDERRAELQAFLDSTEKQGGSCYEMDGNPEEDLVPQIPDIQIDKSLLCTPPPSHEQPKQSRLDQELEGLQSLLKNSLNRVDPRQRQISGFLGSSEVISAIGQWRRDYSALFKEYQDYQSRTQGIIEDQIASTREQVVLVEEENDRIRSRLGKEKFDLDSTCRELIREKSSFRCEIRTLREELEETRAKLEEKTAQYESLSRSKMDDSRPKDDCRNLDHATLESRVKAAELRNRFLQNEIQSLTEGKGQLHHEICEMTQIHDEEVEQLNKCIHKLEHFSGQERKEFGVKYNQLKSVIETQQACILEMEEMMRSKEEENEALLTRIQDQMKQLMTEALNTINVMEEETSTTNNKHNKILHDMTKMQSQFNDLQKELTHHQEYSINLCNQALAALGAAPSNEADFITPDSHQTLSRDENRLTVLTKDSGFSTIKSGKLSEEGMLQKLLGAVIANQGQFREQRERLHGRIQELEHTLKSDKIQHTIEMASSLKKYKMYAHVIKKLRKRHADKSVHPTFTSGSTTEQSKDLTALLNLGGNGDCSKQSTHENSQDIPDTVNCNDMRENHAYFENILKKFDTGHGSDVAL